MQVVADRKERGRARREAGAGAPRAGEDGRLRRLRFAFLQRFVLPPGTRLARLWLSLCRCRIDGDAEVARALAAERAVVAVLHRSLLHLLALVLATKVAERRRFFVLLSASLDGQLLAAALRAFGIDFAVGAAGKDGVRGGRELIRRVRSGQLAVVAVDGPTGPAEVVKPGIAMLASVAAAEVVTVGTRATSGFEFPSWDRCHVPWPWAEIHFTVRCLPVPAKGDLTHFPQRVSRCLSRPDRVPPGGDAPGSTPSSAGVPRTTAPGGAR